MQAFPLPIYWLLTIPSPRIVTQCSRMNTKLIVTNCITINIDIGSLMFFPALRRGSTAARLLRLWVRIPPRAWMYVCCECCVLSGRCLCVWAVHSSRGVLQIVMCLIMIVKPRLDHQGLLRRAGGGGNFLFPFSDIYEPKLNPSNKF